MLGELPSESNYSEEKDLLASFDPLSEFNILSYVTWNEETLKLLSEDWKLRGKIGLNVAEFIHVLLKVFPKPDKRNPNQRKKWAEKLYSFFIQIDSNKSGTVGWEEFLNFITACCVFDREKTRVDTVVQYHFEKEILLPYPAGSGQRHDAGDSCKRFVFRIGRTIKRRSSMALSRVCHGASFVSHIEIKVLQCIAW